MKKTLLFLLTAAIGVSLCAPAQTVTSVNAVGMVKLNVPARGLLFVTAPFKVIAGNSLNDVIGDQLTGGGDSGSSDRILAFNPTTATYQSFWKVDGTGLPEYDGKWFIDDESFPPNPANIQILPGQGFWVQSRTNSIQELVISGEVPDENLSVNIPVGLAQIGLPYPVKLGINTPQFGITQIAVGGGDSGSSDRLIIWNSSTQNYTFLWLVQGTGFPEYDGFWHFDDEQFPPVRANLEIEPGTGFWFQRRTATPATWSPSKPYSWPGN